MISRTFTLSEYTTSAKAQKMIMCGNLLPEQQYSPDAKIVEALKLLHEKITCKILDAFPDCDLRGNSFYRCPAVNQAVGGVKTSNHLFGYAGDYELWKDHSCRNNDLFQWVKMHLTFTELIDEHNKSWIHIAYNPNKLTSTIKVIP